MGNTYVTIFSIALTLILLIFSEIIPKTIGSRSWRSLTPFCGHIIQLLIHLTYPIVFLSEKINQNQKNSPLSREEVIETAEISANEGILKNKRESDHKKNLLCLDNISISEIMTPRSVLYAFEENTKVEELLKNHKTIRFSRIPVYEKNLDQITGIVHRHKILEASSQDLHSLRLKNMMKPIHKVPETISVSACH